jgi:hypothetical protein
MTSPAPPRPTRRSAPLPMLVRQVHTWLSVFVAPSVLFFAVTGALQVYKLHESHGAYEAPLLFQELGAVHKEQVFEADTKHHAAPPPGAGAVRTAAAPRGEPPQPLSAKALKLFFLIVAASLVTTTLLGLWMAAKYSRNKRQAAIIFAAGVLVPLATFLLK